MNNNINKDNENVQNHSCIKEKIIETTILLIKTSDGLVENITIREIAQKADVAVGLINYHFGSKNRLIEICVQRIISQVMKTFSGIENSEKNQPASHQNKSDMTSFITSVFTFLLNNPEISKISMLADLTQPNAESNSSVSYKAIFKALPATEQENVRKLKAFMLLASIQSAFLNRQIIDQLLGFNLYKTDEYYHFFHLVTEILNIK
ncbi:MAG: TetR/AcrR family transcriptional regulator [Clostridiaceae bacterium]|nr:TetR/AcrR family transcriptional regulator [Clostridiaceae bacterium]